MFNDRAVQQCSINASGAFSSSMGTSLLDWFCKAWDDFCHRRLASLGRLLCQHHEASYVKQQRAQAKANAIDNRIGLHMSGKA